MPDLPHLPYEMVIAVLSHMSPAEILNLNLPVEYQKSVLYAKNNTNVRKLFTKYMGIYKYSECLYYKIFINNNFFLKKNIIVYKNKKKFIRVTFDGQYVVAHDLILCFIKCMKSLNCIINKYIENKMLKQLFEIYCPFFVENHEKCCANSNIKFVKIHELLAYICSTYSFGKNLKCIDENVKTVCNKLQTLSNFSLKFFVKI